MHLLYYVCACYTYWHCGQITYRECTCRLYRFSIQLFCKWCVNPSDPHGSWIIHWMIEICYAFFPSLYNNVLGNSVSWGLHELKLVFWRKCQLDSALHVLAWTGVLTSFAMRLIGLIYGSQIMSWFLSSICMVRMYFFQSQSLRRCH